MERTCSQCKKMFEVTASAANRADRSGMNLFCGRVCAGLSRRKNISQEEKRAAKSEYDRQRREQLRELLNEKKREAYYAKHEERLAKQAELRKDPDYRAKHAEYIRCPEYKAKKQVYDQQYREADYADFAEAWRLLLELEKEIRSRQSSYERRKARGYYTRASINRRKDLWKIKLNSMPAI